MTIIDRASAKEARKRSQRESAKEAKQAQRHSSSNKGGRKDATGKTQVDAWYAHVSRSLFGRDVRLLDVPIKVLYGLAAVVMLVVLYFVIFIL